MMPIIRFAYVMAVRRAVSSWRLEAVLFGGMLLAVALHNALGQVGLSLGGHEANHQLLLQTQAHVEVPGKLPASHALAEAP